MCDARKFGQFAGVYRRSTITWRKHHFYFSTREPLGARLDPGSCAGARHDRRVTDRPQTRTRHANGKCEWLLSPAVRLVPTVLASRPSNTHMYLTHTIMLDPLTSVLQYVYRLSITSCL